MSTEIFLNSMPIILLVILGFLLKKTGIFKKEDGSKMTLIVFYATLPATLFLAFSRIGLSFDMIYLPISSAIVIFSIMLISFGITGLLKFPSKIKGTFLATTMVINLGLFAYPFFIIAYGAEGLARGALFDLSNGIIIFTVVYYLASKYGSKRTRRPIETVKKFALTPPLWGLFGGLAFNIFNISTPEIAINFLGILDKATIPLIMISLGLFVERIKSNKKIVALAAFTRMGLGLLIGFLVTLLFGLEGMTRSIVILSSMMPAGMMSFIFAVKEGLDKELAAAIISVTIVLGLIFVPIMISIL